MFHNHLSLVEFLHVETESAKARPIQIPASRIVVLARDPSAKNRLAVCVDRKARRSAVPEGLTTRSRRPSTEKSRPAGSRNDEGTNLTLASLKTSALAYSSRIM